MNIYPGAYGFTTGRARPDVLPAPPTAVSRLDRLRAEAREIITYAGGRADDDARALFLRGLDAEDPETLRRAWEAASADSVHPRPVLPLLDALRSGAEVEVDSDGARFAPDDEEASA